MTTSALDGCGQLGRDRGAQPHVDGRPADHPRLVVEILGQEPLERHLLLAPEHPAQTVGLLAEDHLVPPLGSGQRRLHAGHAAAHDEHRLAASRPAERAGVPASKPISGFTAQRYWRLVVMPAKHSKQRMQGRISSVLPGAGLLGQVGVGHQGAGGVAPRPPCRRR